MRRRRRVVLYTAIDTRAVRRLARDDSSSKTAPPPKDRKDEGKPVFSRHGLAASVSRKTATTVPTNVYGHHAVYAGYRSGVVARGLERTERVTTNARRAL